MADYSRDFSLSHDERMRSCTIRFRCFDTPNAVTLYEQPGDSDEVEELLLAVRRICLNFHCLWSFSLPDSDIARLNGQVARMDVDDRTADLLSRLKAFSEAEPAFDFTIGPVSYLWKRAESVPGEGELARAMEHVGAHLVELDGSAVVKADLSVQVDIGGAAKGYVADALVGYLKGRGVKCADIDLGGNLYMLGDHPAGRPWRVAVRIPEGVEVDPIIVEVSDCGVVTSGSYERFVDIGGKRYQHIIDARTGWPCESDIVSATVLSKSALRADLLATTACLLGSTEFSALAERHPECRFIAITTSGTVLRS